MNAVRKAAVATLAGLATTASLVGTTQSAVAAEPAAAATTSQSTPSPKAYVDHVSYDSGHFNVGIKYRCYTEDDDHWEYGKLQSWVTQTSSGTTYYGVYHKAVCDGHWRYRNVPAYKSNGHLENGKIKVYGQVTDPQHNYHYQSKTYTWHW